jgi:hypothetical protein
MEALCQLSYSPEAVGKGIDAGTPITTERDEIHADPTALGQAAVQSILGTSR